MRDGILRVACAMCLMLVGPARAMELTSADIRGGSVVPKEQVYTRCGGGNLSPALSWTGVPPKAKSVAVTLIDNSVPPSNWSHWIVVNLPPTTTSLAKGISKLPSGTAQIETNFGDAKYDGPCPPRGSGAHRYEFTVWALKTTPTIRPNEAATSVVQKLQAAAISKASLTATYGR